MKTEHAIKFPLRPPLILTQRWAPLDPWRLVHAQCHLSQKVNMCPTWAPLYYKMYDGHFLFLRLSLNTGDQTVFTGSGLHLDLHIICSQGGN